MPPGSNSPSAKVFPGVTVINGASASGTYTLQSKWAWQRAADDLVGHRSGSPWDDAGRRPSHADKRRAWRRELLGNEIRAVLRPGLTEAEIRAAKERLLNLAA